jgi:hypothetical protein
VSDVANCDDSIESRRAADRNREREAEVECACGACIRPFWCGVSGELGDGGEGVGVGAEGVGVECQVVSVVWLAGEENVNTWVL